MSEIDPSAIGWVDREIRRHTWWRRLWSAFYISAASITVICGALATASAGLMKSLDNGPLITAVLAGLTTISASLEKALNLREKWELHRNAQTALEMINLRASAQLIDTKEMIELVEKTAHSYSNQLAEIIAAASLTHTRHSD